MPLIRTMMNVTLARILAALMLAPTGAFATLVVSEGFDYADGGLIANSGGNWVTVNGTTLPIQVSSGAVTVQNLATGASGEDLRRGLGSTFTSGALYYSALITPLTAPTSLNGDYFFSPYSTAPTGGGFMGRIFLSATATGFTFGISNGTSTPVDWTSDISLNTAYLVIGRVDVTTRTATFGVFDPLSPPTSDAQLTVSGGVTAASATSVDSIALRQGSSAGAAFTAKLDDIKVGSDLADVTSPAPVPEPSTALTLIGGGVSLLGMRRLRRTQ